MVRTSVHVVTLAVSLLSPLVRPAGAQDRGRDEKAAPAVPTSSLPPAGLCRVWLRDVPAGQQPAPTDCASAIRKAPSSATVLFGDPKSESAQKLQAKQVPPGTRPYGGSDRGTPGGGRSATMRGGPRGAGARGGPPPAVNHPPAAPPAKPREKPLS